jgi:hypothetical protein
MPEQITRLLVFFLLVLLGYFVIRPALIPQSYGLYGRYRAAALAEIGGRALAHTGRAECAGCHEEQADVLATSQHAHISCESCHAAGAAHAADPLGIDQPVPPEEGMRQFCGLCHHARVGRPEWLPQVDIGNHYDGDACNACHPPHEVMAW